LHSFSLFTAWLFNFLAKEYLRKGARKMLVILTKGWTTLKITFGIISVKLVAFALLFFAFCSTEIIVACSMLEALMVYLISEHGRMLNPGRELRGMLSCAFTLKL